MEILQSLWVLFPLVVSKICSLEYLALNTMQYFSLCLAYIITTNSNNESCKVKFYQSIYRLAMYRITEGVVK